MPQEEHRNNPPAPKMTPTSEGVSLRAVDNTSSNEYAGRKVGRHL